MSGDVADRRFGDSTVHAFAGASGHSGAAIGFLAIAALAILLSVSGAYDTDELSLAHRGLFWFIFSALVIGQVCAIDRLLSAQLSFLRVTPPLAGACAIACTILLTALEVEGLKRTPILPKDPDPLLPFILFVAPPVATIGLVALIARHWLVAGARPQSDLFKAAAAPAVQSQEAGGPPQADLLNLSDLDSDRVLRVRSHDHYLEVQTGETTHFVRGRMKDAVKCLPPELGLQVHRSWWVAFDHIAVVQPAGRDRQIILKDGAEVPVARGRLPALREYGPLSSRSR